MEFGSDFSIFLPVLSLLSSFIWNDKIFFKVSFFCKMCVKIYRIFTVFGSSMTRFLRIFVFNLILNPMLRYSKISNLVLVRLVFENTSFMKIGSVVENLVRYQHFFLGVRVGLRLDITQGSSNLYISPNLIKIGLWFAMFWTFGN